MKTRTRIDTEEPVCKKLFLTTNEVCLLLNMGKSCALAFLARYGIMPVDLGKGRGKGLRWRMTAVIKLADILHTEAQTARQIPSKKSSPFSLRGKSAKDLMAEFVGCKSPNYEVCNGN